MISLGLFLLWMHRRRKLRAQPLLEDGDSEQTSMMRVSPFVHHPLLPRQGIQKSSLGMSTDVTSSDESMRAECGPQPLTSRSHHFSPAAASVHKHLFHSNYQHPFMADTSSGLLDQDTSAVGVGDETQCQQADVGRDPLRGVLHQDSGWRSREESTTPLEDIPPLYTTT